MTATHHQRLPVRSATTPADRKARQWSATRWWTVVVVALLMPIGATITGKPLSPYHLLAPLVLFVAAHELRVFARSFFALLIWSLTAMFAIGLVNGGLRGGPLLSAYHFLAPYAALPAGYLVIRRFGERAWQLAALCGVVPVSLTLLLGLGRMTRSGLGAAGSGRFFSVGFRVPLLAGGAAVNSWGTLLVSTMLVSVIALTRCRGLSSTRRIILIVGLAASTACISQSASRTNTFAAGLVLLYFMVNAFRGDVVVTVRHRLPGIVALSIVACIIMGLGLRVAAEQTRVARVFSSVSAGAPTAEYRGRSERVKAMASDIANSPVFGTGFHDFGLHHEKFANSSPHNQWLGALHKLGIFGGVIYLYMLAPFFRRGIRSQLGVLAWICTALLGIPYDALTAPPGGVALLFVLGGLAVADAAGAAAS